jgi:hypothetical protein
MTGTAKDDPEKRIPYERPQLFDLGGGVAYAASPPVACGPGGSAAQGSCQNGGTAGQGNCITGGTATQGNCTAGAQATQGNCIAGTHAQQGVCQTGDRAGSCTAGG